jgi:hypothetical protein
MMTYAYATITWTGGTQVNGDAVNDTEEGRGES